MSSKVKVEAPSRSSSKETIVQMVGITKRFPGVVANDHIDFDIRSGEVHALLGENGAGKTTLMNILYGLYQPDEGEIYFYGQKVRIKSPKDAIRLGIVMSHQIFRQVLRFSIAENIALHTSLGLILSKKEIERRISEIANELGWDIDPNAKIYQLSAETRQKIEIVKALLYEPKVLILDEPTSLLSLQGKLELFKQIKRLKEKGLGIVYITHKLDEVLAISDRITILRKGKKVKVLNTSEATKEDLARYMVGRDVLFTLTKTPSKKKGKPVLEVKNLHVLGDRNEKAVNGVSFTVYEGEILGVAGVGGSGQRELAEAIAGLRKVKTGEIRILGENLTNANPRKIAERGVGFIPEDRLVKGLVPELDIKENLILRMYFKPPCRKGLFLDEDFIRKYCDEKICQYNIVAPDLSTKVKFLSGGNLQRLLLARETSWNPKLLIAAYPTFGLDVASTEYVRKLLLKLRDMGSAILLISEDLDEIMMLSDRIAVLYEGKLMGILNAEEATKERIGLMMTGTPKEKLPNKTDKDT